MQALVFHPCVLWSHRVLLRSWKTHIKLLCIKSVNSVKWLIIEETTFTSKASVKNTGRETVNIFLFYQVHDIVDRVGVGPLLHLFTARNSCAVVMFSHVSVSHSVREAGWYVRVVAYRRAYRDVSPGVGVSRGWASQRGGPDMEPAREWVITPLLLTPPKHARLTSGWYASYWNAFLSALISFLLSFLHSEPDCGLMGAFDWCIYRFKRRALRVSDADPHKHICDQLPWCNYILATHFNLH